MSGYQDTEREQVSEETFVERLGLEVTHCGSCHSDMASAGEYEWSPAWGGVLLEAEGMEVEEACCGVSTALEGWAPK